MNKLSIASFNEEFTVDQKNAFEEFNDWLEQKNDLKPFVLKGFAGTGKTFLSIRFLHLVERIGICWTVAAPTHKAVDVVRQALLIEDLKAPWYPSTIHRLLRLKLKRKGSQELCEQTEQTSSSLENLGLVLIDEASMIDCNLLEIVLQCANTYGTRLVFVGDPAQLPPVGEARSPVFSMKRSQVVLLHEVVRHQGPVLKLASCLRDGSLPCSLPPCNFIVEEKLGVVGCIRKKLWLAKAQKALKTAADEENPNNVRILCYTNRTLEGLVPHARRAIHGEMADQLPVLPGEVLISRNAVMSAASVGESEDKEEPDMLLGSNRELIVRDVSPENCDLADLGLVGIDGLNIPTIDTLKISASSGEMEFCLRMLPLVGTKSRKILDETLRRLSIFAKESGKKDGRSLWRQFFLIRDSFASLGPASVLTIHRSQGSTFGEVFIAPDIFWPDDPVFRKQLSYVAVSRAKKAVWFSSDKEDSAKREIWINQIKT